MGGGLQEPETSSGNPETVSVSVAAQEGVPTYPGSGAQ